MLVESPADVLVVGSINVDLVVRVERLPVAGETVTGGAFARHPGGKGGNQAVAAARLGAGVSFVGAVGSDADGPGAMDDLAREGIDVSGVSLLEGAATGVALIVVDAAGENQIAVAPGANALLAGELVTAVVSRLRTRTGGVLLASLELSDDAVLAGARFAAAHGLHIVINPAPARPLPAELLALRPILLPNAGEASLLSGVADPSEGARELFRSTGSEVVVTLGANGAMLCRGEELIRLPAFEIDVVDTTGAGDTFAGAFAAELAAGADVESAARFAMAAAALSVRREGARGGMPARAEVEGLLGQVWRAECDSNPRAED